MQLDPPLAISFPAQVPNPPGRTPVTTQVGRPPATVRTPRTDTASGVGGLGSVPREAPTALHNVLESLEDAALLLLIVFMVPAVIMLLALPFLLITRIAVEIGRRW